MAADTLLFNITSFIAGLFLLEYGADKFIDHTAIVTKRVNVSPTLVGLLTCGAEREELIVIAVALAQKKPDLALGNLTGSSVANILGSFSLGLIFLGDGVVFDRSSKIYTGLLFLLTSVFLGFLLSAVNIDNLVLRWCFGVFLIVEFVVYAGSVAVMIYRGTLTAPEDDSDSESESDSESGINSSDNEESENDSEEEEDEEEEEEHRLTLLRHQKLPRPQPTQPKKRKESKKRIKPLRHHILRLVPGLAALLVSGYVLSHSAATIGQELSLSGTAVGTTILSLATTLPEKMVAIFSGMRKQPGIMIANTVGSNIFLVTLCGGVMLLAGGDLQRGDQGVLIVTNFEMSVMLIASILIAGVVMMGAKRWMGWVMLGMYVAFLGVEIHTGRRTADGD
ncbi:Sodium/calcium exchanger protein-domain-containing protein [Podospora australis]|uniref:Sodium/calcium exchanger protein-domain-containing protein n=1 Tax=Podospora australis TaxID=1536484 RepID=A0AAN7ALZ5_9PEZI|nr:Sodium/calcium exchanger protein-domain-containing protein [Podospora australis]